MDIFGESMISATAYSLATVLDIMALSPGHPIPRVLPAVPALSTAHSHYSPPPSYGQHDVVPSPTRPLPQVPFTLSPHGSPPHASTSMLLVPPPVSLPQRSHSPTCPPYPPTPPPPDSTFLVGPSTKVLAEVDDHDEQQGSSDLNRECTVMNSDKEAPDGVQVSLWWPQRLGMPTQYILARTKYH
ncbi:hypothetical protein EDD22DRAFT_349825 [Suillus occidentalis]|nr:hypothetical protein EDD22DRAFT_349825 [Suillus occidentalis]